MTDGDDLDGRLVYSIVGAFFDVHDALGFSFLEYRYLAALEHELVARGHRVGREIPVAVRDREIGVHRLDLLVDGRVVAEAKSTHALPPVASRQLYDYLRATGLRTGLLLHFGAEPRFHRLSIGRG